jgi:hypothetical protein
LVPGRSLKCFSARFKTNSVIHPALYSMEIDGYVVGVKQPERGAELSPSSIARFENEWSCISIPQ